MDRSRALACIPIRHPQGQASTGKGGLLLTYPVLPAPHPWRPRFGGGVRWRRLQLDRMGSEVWELIDGQRTVADIAREFGQRHQLNPREAELAVSSFLRQLGKRQLVALREPKERTDLST